LAKSWEERKKGEKNETMVQITTSIWKMVLCVCQQANGNGTVHKTRVRDQLRTSTQWKTWRTR
jgi:hypothetical protein